MRFFWYWVAALAMIGVTVLSLWFFVTDNINDNYEKDRCAHFAELNPAYEIKYDKYLKCAIKLDGLWISAYNLKGIVK